MFICLEKVKDHQIPSYYFCYSKEVLGTYYNLRSPTEHNHTTPLQAGGIWDSITTLDPPQNLTTQNPYKQEVIGSIITLDSHTEHNHTKPQQAGGIGDF